MLIYGLAKIRNEEKILQETLDHWGKICTGGLVITDDASTDNSVEICKNHPAVKEVVEVEHWDPDREKAEWMNRQRALDRAKHIAEPNDWFCYFDADERLFFNDWEYLFDSNIKAIACKLYDVYITPDDADEPDHNKREWVGPEFRTIVFFFKNSPYLSYDKPDQRVVNLEPGIQIPVAGIVKHFGKGLSVKHWEETVNYYVDFWPKYSSKWEKRRGKAIKKDFKSDFGNKLIKFNDVLSKRTEGFPLETQAYGKN